MTETTQDVRRQLTKLLREARIGMLTTMTHDGRHLSRPMGLQEAEFDGDLWFFVDESSAKVAQIREHPEVNVSFSDASQSWVSIAGRAEVFHDRNRAEQLWNPLLEGWFPDGLDTPGLCLLRIKAESAELWEASHGRVLTLIAYAKAAVTGVQADVGENRTVRLSGS